MKKNLLLKKNIKKYQNNEIDINDVVVDKNDNKNYSLKDNFDDISYLLEIANGFIDRNFLFGELFYHNTEEEELKKLLKVFMEKDELLEHFLELENNNEKVKVITNALPFLPEDWLEKNMCFLTENLNILEINSEKTRRLYVEEIEKSSCLEADVVQNIIFSINAHLFSKESFDVNFIKNIMSCVELLNTPKHRFFEIFKLILKDFYAKDIMSFINFQIKDPENFTLEFLENYIDFIENAMSEANIDLKEILRPDIENVAAEFFLFEPLIFKAIINKFKNSESEYFINELFIIGQKIAKSHYFGLMNKSSEFIDNKDYISLMITEIEKEKILNNMEEVNVSIILKKRI